MNSLSAGFNWDLAMERWCEDADSPLVGISFLPMEIQMEILLHVQLDDSLQLEMVCRLWFCIMRGHEFRSKKLSLVCQQRIEHFPGYEVIPMFLKLKGWRYLIASKRVLVPTEEKSSLTLATIVYDAGYSMYEGFWIPLPDHVASTPSVPHVVPHGYGVFYHECPLGEVLQNATQPSITIIIHGMWEVGLLVKGTVRRNGGLLFIIRSDEGACLYEGVSYSSNGRRFEGLFHTSASISTRLHELYSYARHDPSAYTMPYRGQWYNADNSKGDRVEGNDPEIEGMMERNRFYDKEMVTIRAIKDRNRRAEAEMFLHGQLQQMEQKK